MSPIVQYNLTSSKDVKDLDQTYVYSSSKLSPLSASDSCLNRQQRRIKANTVNRTVSWSWSQTAQATRQVLLRLQVKRTRLSGNASSDLKTLLITQPLLPRFMSSCHPNPKSKTTNSADYLFCQTVRQATSKSSQAH